MAARAYRRALATRPPRILDVICRTTGMGFAAVARVTEERWIACAVRESIQFGLEPGGELKVATTICDEIRQNRDVVVIDHVAEDEACCEHPTPKMWFPELYFDADHLCRTARSSARLARSIFDRPT